MRRLSTPRLSLVAPTSARLLPSQKHFTFIDPAFFSHVRTRARLFYSANRRFKSALQRAVQSGWIDPINHAVERWKPIGVHSPCPQGPLFLDQVSQFVSCRCIAATSTDNVFVRAILEDVVFLHGSFRDRSCRSHAAVFPSIIRSYGLVSWADNEDGGGDSESLRQAANLSNVEFAFAGEDF